MATKKDRLQMIYEKDGRNTSSSDPEMMESRIFIGNMSKKVTRHHIEQLFSKYGKVLGVSLHRSYGFVQFDTRDGAHKAVKGENGNDLCGFKMDICVATERRKGGAGGAPDKGRGEEKRGGRRPRSRSPFSNRWGGRDDHLGRYDKFSPPRMRGSPLDPYRDPYGPPPGRDPYLYPPDGLFDRFPPPRDFYDYPVPPSRDYRSPPPPPFIDYPPPIGRRDRYERDPWDYPPSRHIPPAREREPLLPTPPPRREERDSFKPLPQPSSSSSSARPSCEAQVIYVNILQKEYAQRVRERIEALGLMVESLHLSPTVSLSEALDNASHRGLLYTVIVTNQHEVHRSVTLTILHGRNPQEHKNMPLDDCISLIDRDYEKYTLNSGGSSGDDKCAGLMAKAAAGHTLTNTELNALITGLQHKQKRTSAGSSRLDGRDNMISNDDIQQQQADLQAKILSLLGSSAVMPSGSSPFVGSDGFRAVKGFGGYR